MRNDIQKGNEAKVIKDITRLIVPSTEALAIRGAKHLEILIESVNEGWNHSLPVTRPRLQPDYTVGFKRMAADQLKRLQPILDFEETSFYTSTYLPSFPFQSYEVKCGALALDTADRQKAHSMTVAVRVAVFFLEFSRLVRREQELHRAILAFPISHDDEKVKNYGYDPVCHQ